ncbi:MAG: alkaline phosphatase D family protein, partial [Pseudanabaena sp. ELA607]
WNPTNFAEYYFVTTDRLDTVIDGITTAIPNSSTPVNQIGRSRLWRLTFDDITNPDAGGKIDMLLDGTEGQTMFDNLTIDKYGHITLLEDTGNAEHSGKVWQYDIATDKLTQLAQLDANRFGNVVNGVVTPATAPFTIDEETSGVIDVQDILGPGWSLLDAQAHYTKDANGNPLPADLVEGGQLLAMYNPTTAASAAKTASKTGPSSSSTPYIVPVAPGVEVKSILTVGDAAPNGYKMSGIPDGLGAFDNGDGTFTLLMNHEIANTSGAVRTHGGKGAFVSTWVIKKSDLSVVSGGDLIQKVYNWDTVTQASATTTSTIDFSRFCSADLPAVSAFYNSATGKGTAERLFMNGEEGGSTGFALATVATGTNKGSAYVLGKFNLTTNGNGSGLTGVGGWENLLANPYAQDKTIVIGNNDGGTGLMAQSVAVYVGTKTNTGTEVEKAGLTNGTIKFVNVAGNTAEIANTTTRATNIPLSTTFTLSATASTTFSRPEDGAWNPSNYSEYYFVTTDRLDTVIDGITTAIPNSSTPVNQIGRSRLWRLTFDDITNPDAGGKIDMLLDGTEGQTMFDNMTIDRYGHITLLEDTGNSEHSGKVWQYDIPTDKLTQLAQFDTTRFGNVVNGVVTPATAPFTIDEETSGVIDVQDILGPGWSLLDAQAHYTKDANGNTLPADLVEGGQLLAIYNPTTANSFNTVKNKVDFSGVAAGDATTNSEILWTRTIDTNTKQGIMAKLTVLVSTDATFSSIAKSYTVTSDPNRDYTAKIDATGLQANTRYYYRFITTGGDTSPVGTFKTAAALTAKTAVRFAFSGDADGLFRPYVSTQNFKSLNLDYFLFEGDTIYETSSGVAGTPNFSATAVGSPTGALLPITDANASQALIDYQRKYLENLQPTTPGGFAGLQTLFASQGNYTLLDNHELGNRQLINGGAPSVLATDISPSSTTGNTPVNNQNGSNNTAYDVNTTGAFINKTIPFKTLLQAYSTYQPIRETTISAPNDARTDGTQQLYSAQQWGRNSVFVNLDTRSYRDVRLKKADGSSDDTGLRADNAQRTMLGATQFEWLKKTLLDAQNNGTIWKFVATSDPIDQIGAIGDGSDGGKSWAGGYRAERNKLLNFIADNNIKNVVFLATDDHQNRINELTYTDKNGVVKVLQNALSVVDGPIGAGGPDAITDHSITNIQAETKKLFDKQVAAGVNPIGLATSLTDPNSAGLVVKNIKREGDANPTANASSSLASAFDFYSPDTFNYTVFDVSADGKTLNVDVQGVNSYVKNTFLEPSANNPVRSILSFSLDATVDKKLVKVSDDVFDLSANSSTEAKLKITLTKGAGQIYELGVVVVDDATGAIGGVLPTAADYAKLVLSKGKVILSGIDNLPNGYAPSASDLTRLLQLSPDQSLRFYMIKNNTTGDDVNRNGLGTNLQFSPVQKVTDLGSNKFSIDFTSLSATIESSTDNVALGTGLQGASQGEVIDLRTTTGPVKADFTVNREAAYNNFVGFYKVVNETGGIDTNGDNVADFNPGDARYTVEALKLRVSGIDLAVDNQGTAAIGGKQFTGGAIYAPFLISNGTVDQALAGQAQVFFAYLGANQDKVDHVRLLGANTFGFEDLYGGGDRDYNDVIVKAKLTL